MQVESKDLGKYFKELSAGVKKTKKDLFEKEAEIFFQDIVKYIEDVLVPDGSRKFIISYYNDNYIETRYGESMAIVEVEIQKQKFNWCEFPIYHPDHYFNVMANFDVLWDNTPLSEKLFLFNRLMDYVTTRCVDCNLNIISYNARNKYEYSITW